MCNTKPINNETPLTPKQQKLLARYREWNTYNHLPMSGERAMPDLLPWDTDIKMIPTPEQAAVFNQRLREALTRPLPMC